MRLVRGFLGGVGWFFYLLPEPLYVACVKTLAFAIRATGIRRRVIRENLARLKALQAVPGDLENRIDEHLAQVYLELFFSFGPMGRLVERDVVATGVEHWRAAIAQGKGAFFLSSHVGNWEVMVCRGGWVEKMGLLMVTKRLKPAWFHDLFEGARAQWGVSGTYEPRTLRDVLRALKENRIVGFVLDQYTGPPVAARVPFLGVPVGTNIALATLAKRTEVPVIPVVIYRTGWRKYQIDLRPPLQWISDPNPDREVALNTARYTEIIERDVRAHPEQWLWTHRRFKGDLSPLRPEEWAESRKK